MSDASDKHDEQCADLKKAAAICEQRGQSLLDSLISLQTEVDELKTDLHYCNGVSDLAMKHRDIAEAEVERLKDALKYIKQKGHEGGFLRGKGFALATLADAALKSTEKDDE